MKKKSLLIMGLCLLMAAVPSQAAARKNAQPKMAIEEVNGILQHLDTAEIIEIGDEKEIDVDAYVDGAPNRDCGNIYKIDVKKGQSIQFSTNGAHMAYLGLYDSSGIPLGRNADPSFSFYQAKGEKCGQYYIGFMSSKTTSLYLVASSYGGYDQYTLTVRAGKPFNQTVSSRFLFDSMYTFVPKESGQYIFTVNSPKVTALVNIADFTMESDLDLDNYDTVNSDDGVFSVVKANLVAGVTYTILTYPLMYDYGFDVPYTISLTSAVSSQKADNLISAITDIKHPKESDILAVRNYYDNLTEAEKALVTKSSVLAEAEKSFQENTTVGKKQISKVQSPSKGTVAISYKKVSGADGYELKYSVKKSFKGAKVRNIFGTIKKQTVTLKKLRSHKKYFIKIRAFKKYNGKKYYGPFSDAKAIIVK